MERRSRIRRWALPVMAVGFAVVMATTPVGAHVTDNTKHVGAHVWKDYVRAQALKLFFTKSQSDARFVNESDHLWAKVDADATEARLLAGDGVYVRPGPETDGTDSDDGVARIGTGQFNVDFLRDVSGCGWLATLNDNAALIAENGEIAVQLESALSPNTLRVRTFDSAGTAEDPADSDGFTVQVIC